MCSAVSPSVEQQSIHRSRGCGLLMWVPGAILLPSLFSYIRIGLVLVVTLFRRTQQGTNCISCACAPNTRALVSVCVCVFSVGSADYCHCATVQIRAMREVFKIRRACMLCGNPPQMPRVRPETTSSGSTQRHWRSGKCKILCARTTEPPGRLEHLCVRARTLEHW